MSAALQREEELDSPLTGGLQDELLAALQSGLMPRYVALVCGVAPKTLYGWLDAGAKRDAVNPYRDFCVRWVRAEAELMRHYVEIWSRGGFGAREAREVLERRWPSVWGKAADPPYEPLQPTSSNAEEQDMLEAILADPASYGMLDLFIKHDRLTPAERAELGQQHAALPESSE